jgi:ABC-type Na+ efflux pump permease subunit
MSEIALPRQPGKWALRWAITRNEIRNIARHPYHLLSLAIPVLLSLAFTFVFSALDETNELIVVVYDAESSALVAALREMPEVTLQEVDSETAVLNALAEDATGGLVIPVGFDAAVTNQQTPELPVYINTDARSVNIATFQRLLSEQIWAMRYDSPPVHITWQEQNQPGETFYSLPGESFVFLTFILLGLTMPTLALLPQLMVEEREGGALPALLASPVALADLLIGRGAAIFFYTMLAAAALMAINQGWVGDVAVTAVALFLTTLMLIGIGLFAGLWSKSKQQCNNVAGFLGIGLNLPSWFALVPLAGLAILPALFIRLIPTYYFTNTLIYSLNGRATPQTVGLNLLILTGCTIAAFVMVRWRLGQRPLV